MNDEPNGENISVVQFKPGHSELEKSNENFKRDLEALKSHADLSAKRLRYYYLAFRKEGFTRRQSMAMLMRYM